MREGLYELTIVGTADGENLAERIIDGRTYVEAKPGQEYAVVFGVHKDVNGEFPMKECMAYVYIDGKAVDKHLLNPSNASKNSSAGVITQGYDFDSDHTQSFEFMIAPTITDYADSAESATGQVMVLFYEVEKCQEPFGDIACFPLASSRTPSTEKNMPEKQPSLMTRPGSVKPLPEIGCAPTSPDKMHSWRRVRDGPDVTRQLKCHTANTLDYLQHFLSTNRHTCSLGTAGAEQPCGSAVVVTDSKNQPAAPSQTEALPARSTSSTAAQPPLQAPVQIAGGALPVPGASSRPVNKSKKDTPPAKTASTTATQPVPGVPSVRTPVLGEVADLKITGSKRKVDGDQELDPARR